MPHTASLGDLVAGPGVVTGCWCTLPHHSVAEALAAAGYSTVLLDLQHGHIAWDVLAPLVHAVESAGAAPIVRIASCDPSSVDRALDMGAQGVIAPMISTASEARKLARWMRYPPLGERSYSPNRWNAAGVVQANESVVCIPMIETVAALENIDEIAAVEGVGGLFIGPSDLALSLGIPMRKTHPQILRAVDAVVRAARRRGIFVATVAQDQEHAEDLVARGVKLVTLGSDVGFVAGGARQSARQLNRIR